MGFPGIPSPRDPAVRGLPALDGDGDADVRCAHLYGEGTPAPWVDAAIRWFPSFPEEIRVCFTSLGSRAGTGVVLAPNPAARHRLPPAEVRQSGSCPALRPIPCSRLRAELQARKQPVMEPPPAHGASGPSAVTASPPRWEIGIYAAGAVVLLGVAALNLWKLWRSGTYPAPSPFPNYDYRYLEQKYGAAHPDTKHKVKGWKPSFPAPTELQGQSHPQHPRCCWGVRGDSVELGHGAWEVQGLLQQQPGARQRLSGIREVAADPHCPLALWGGMGLSCLVFMESQSSSDWKGS